MAISRKVTEAKLAKMEANLRLSLAETNEAYRLAFAVIRDEMKRQGIMLKYVSRYDVIHAAGELILAEPEIRKMAKHNLARRTSK